MKSSGSVFARTLFLSMALILSMFSPALGAGTGAVTALAQGGTSVPEGNVSGTWSATGSPYLVEGNITVPTGQTLTVEPGVEVLFQSWYKLTVNGTLLAEGTAEANILFTTTALPTPRWLGIRFVNASDNSRLSYAIVEHGRASGSGTENRGGGIYIENSSPTISHTTIRNNLAGTYGGGIYLLNSNAQLHDNVIVDNKARYGAGVYMKDSNPELLRNTISGNSVTVIGTYTTPTGAGGGLYVYSSAPVLQDNVITDNLVEGQLNSNVYGGGIALVYAEPLLINNTISGNRALGGGGYYSTFLGGGVYSSRSRPVVVNTILWDNTPESVYVAYADPFFALTFAYTDLQGGQAGIVTDGSTTINWLDGNINADPLFVDPANGDYTLPSNSPAIDAGTAYFEWNGQVIVELQAGEYNGNDPDMGAIESGGGASPPNQPPVAVASATPTTGSAPLDVQFSAAGSSDPDGTVVAHAWEFGDGTTASGADPVHTYGATGSYVAMLTVTDDDGATHSDSVTITVVDGTTIPAGDVSGTWAAAGSPYRIDGDVVVPAGQTLAIEAGVNVLFNSWYKLTVNGTLLARGTAASPVLFTGSAASPGWLGIRFVNASDASHLDFVIVENGQATGADPENKGGGIYIENSSPTISNSTIRNNEAKQSGGGLYLTGSNAILTGNTIVDNIVGYGSVSGGGIALYNNSNAEITNNVIRGNRVSANGGFSIGSGYGGAIIAHSSDPALRGNLIVDNRVEGSNSNHYGGALYLYYADAVLVNNTITGNSAGTSSGVQITYAGGAIFEYQSHPVLVNNILWNDIPNELAGSDQGLPGSFTVAFSDVQGGQAGIITNNNTTVSWLDGNLDTDPLFANPGGGDWTLQSGSPAIDAGTAYFDWNGQVLVDLQPGEYNGAAPDMGAFEAEGTAPPPNQSPVAAASATPTSGAAPLAVQFSAAGSSDPDGAIVAYAWDFGDGTTASVANPAHTYDSAGTYQATLTVTDDDGATGSDSVTITVSDTTQNRVHVDSQEVVRRSRGGRWFAVDRVTVVDQNGAGVANATVTARFYGPTEGQASRATNGDGRVLLSTSWTTNPQGIWCFEILSITAEGYVYDPAANVVTVQCEAQ